MLFLIMKLFVDFPKLGISDVGVDLGGGDRGMSEHGLDGTDVSTIS